MKQYIIKFSFLIALLFVIEACNKDALIDLNNSYQNYQLKKEEIIDNNTEIERRIKLIKDGNIPSELQVKLKPSYDEKSNQLDSITEYENKKKDIENELKKYKE